MRVSFLKPYTLYSIIDKDSSYRAGCSIEEFRKLKRIVEKYFVKMTWEYFQIQWFG